MALLEKYRAPTDRFWTQALKQVYNGAALEDSTHFTPGRGGGPSPKGAGGLPTGTPLGGGACSQLFGAQANTR